VQRKKERDEQHARDRQRLTDMRGASARPPPTGILDIIRSSQPRPQMFEHSANPSTSDFVHGSSESTIPPHFANVGPKDSLMDIEPLIPSYMHPISHDPTEKQQRLQEQFNEMLRQAEHRDEFGEDDSDDNIANELRNLGEVTKCKPSEFELICRLNLIGVEDTVVDPDDILDYFSKIPVEKDYAPYPNKLVCRFSILQFRQANMRLNDELMLLDILDNLPRLRLSSNLLKMVFWILKECGVANVPSYEAFRKMQNNLREFCGSEPLLSQSALGNIFYVNDIRDTIKRVCYRSLLF